MIKISRRMKINTLIIIIIIIIIEVTCNILKSTPPSTSVSEKHWISIYPQLGRINASMPILGSSKVGFVAESSKDELLGKITNQYGIRDDILNYILKTIPAENESALFHAIKMAQYTQQMYISNDRETAIKEAESMGASIDCLMDSYGMVNTDNLVVALDKIRDDTPLRLHQERVGEQLMGWQVIKANMTPIDKLCNSGDY